MKNKALVTVLALGALATPLMACGVTSSSSSSSAASSSEATSEASSSLADPIAVAAKDSIGYLDYTAQAAEGMASRTFSTVPTIKNVDGYDFAVTYTGVQKTAYEGASISFYQDTDPDLLNPVSTCTVVAPIRDPNNNAKFILFVMTAHILYGGKEYATADFNVRCDPLTVYSLEAVASLTSGAVVATYGIYEGKYPNATDVYWVGDRESGMTAYKPSIEGTVAVGDYVEIIGKYSPYSGLAEIGSCTMKKVDATNANVVSLGVATPVTLVWDGTYALKTKDESRAIQATGVVGTVTVSATSGDITADFKVGSASISVYAKKASMSTAAFASISAIKKDDTVTVNGYLGCYNTFQIINPSVAK